jgi:hypothetical protein
MSQLGGSILGFPGSELPPLADSIRIEFLFGQGAPGAMLGKKGDLYLDGNTRYLYKKISAHGWKLSGVLSSQILTGSAAPDDGDGNPGDLYFRANGEAYSKGATTWDLIADLTGPVGATGATGAAGTVSAASALVLEEVFSTPSTSMGEVQVYNLFDELRWRLESDGTEYIAAALNQPQTFTAAQNVATHVLADGATINTDCSLSNVFRVVLGGDRTLADPTNLVDGGTYVWMVRQDSTGGRSLTYGSAFIWMGGNVTPSLSVDPGATDLITCISDGTSLFCNFVGA